MTRKADDKVTRVALDWSNRKWSLDTPSSFGILCRFVQLAVGLLIPRLLVAVVALPHVLSCSPGVGQECSTGPASDVEEFCRMISLQMVPEVNPVFYPAFGAARASNRRWRWPESCDGAVAKNRLESVEVPSFRACSRLVVAVSAPLLLLLDHVLCGLLIVVCAVCIVVVLLRMGYLPFRWRTGRKAQCYGI